MLFDEKIIPIYLIIMLMCDKVTNKNLIDSNPLFRLLRNPFHIKIVIFLS